jgi:hypothetical protein
MTNPTREELLASLAIAEKASKGPWKPHSRDVDVPDDEPDKDMGLGSFLGWDVIGPPDAERGQFARGWDAHMISDAGNNYAWYIRYTLELLAEKEERDGR